MRGVGLDLVHLDDLPADEEEQERVAAHALLPRERSRLGTGPGRRRSLAGILALKEATMKALGAGVGQGVSWTDIEVTHHAAGWSVSVPRLGRGTCRITASVSGGRRLVVAVVFLEADEGRP